MTRTLCIDFDGVIHSYTSPWVDAMTIPDPPVPHAFGWLIELDGHREENGRPSFELCIYSSRSRHDIGIEAMKKWFTKQGLPERVLNNLRFPTQKPAAYLTIDDRCFLFEGMFPSVRTLLNFKPWNKREREEKKGPPLDVGPITEFVEGPGIAVGNINAAEKIEVPNAPKYELERALQEQLKHNQWLSSELRKAEEELEAIRSKGKLRACPFCGDVDVHLCSSFFDNGNNWWAECSSCSATGPEGESRKMAAKRWNLRSGLDRGEH